MPFDAPTKASSLSASRSGLPRVAPMLVVVQPQKRGVPRAPQLPARPATAGAFSRRLGGAAFECRGAAAAARPASALQRSRTRAARDLGEVTASLCKDLDGWLGKYQGALRAVDGLRSATRFDVSLLLVCGEHATQRGLLSAIYPAFGPRDTFCVALRGHSRSDAHLLGA